MKWILLFSTALALSKGLPSNVQKTPDHGNRDGKFFSLFSVVSFDNAVCQSRSILTSGASTRFREGTCFTTSECTSKGGTGEGSCASGFGICCVFQSRTCGSTVSQNCTYIQNPNFPNTLQGTTACQFTVNKGDSAICELRLDFERFTTLGPVDTLETNGGVCRDLFTVTGLSTGQTIPQICGVNNGQHIYLEVGRENGDSASLNFAFTGASTIRTWDIKVSQIPCRANFRAPNGCLQYHTGATGRITTFNFGDAGNFAHLANQMYDVCIRQERGFCCIQYQPCTDAGSFSLHASANPAASLIDTACTQDYIVIASSTGSECEQSTQFSSRYCGNILNGLTASTVNAPVCDCTLPFQVGIRTDANNDGANLQSRGLCLTYTQIRC